MPQMPLWRERAREIVETLVVMQLELVHTEKGKMCVNVRVVDSWRQQFVFALFLYSTLNICIWAPTPKPPKPVAVLSEIILLPHFMRTCSESFRLLRQTDATDNLTYLPVVCARCTRTQTRLKSELIATTFNLLQKHTHTHTHFNPFDMFVKS